jgi:hypothetical protein
MKRSLSPSQSKVDTSSKKHYSVEEQRKRAKEWSDRELLKVNVSSASTSRKSLGASAKKASLAEEDGAENALVIKKDRKKRQSLTVLESEQKKKSKGIEEVEDEADEQSIASSVNTRLRTRQSTTTTTTKDPTPTKTTTGRKTRQSLSVLPPITDDDYTDLSQHDHNSPVLLAANRRKSTRKSLLPVSTTIQMTESSQQIQAESSEKISNTVSSLPQPVSPK